MGVLWLAQVRFVHLAVFTLAMIPLFICLFYLSSRQIHTTTPSKRNFDMQLLQKSIVILNKNNASAVTFMKEITKVPLTSSHQSNFSKSPRQVSNLTRNVLAKDIYEAGYVDVNPQICPNLGKDLKLLIVVTSAPVNEKSRTAIRETWGHYAIRKDIAISFILGATSDPKIIDSIEKEQEIYGDIIRGKFIDTYKNLGLKTISILEWVHNYCPKAWFTLKTDDDMFINVSLLLALIQKLRPKKRAIYGRLAKKWTPCRNKASKYYISPEVYRPEVFPDFTTGPAYLFPTNLSKELYEAALKHTYVNCEDVFVTGLVARTINIKRMHIPEFANERITLSACNIQNKISIHMVKRLEQYNLWQKLHEVAWCRRIPLLNLN